MRSSNYGHVFGIYVLADSSDDSKVFGIKWPNQTCVGEYDGRKVYFVLMYFEYHEDSIDFKTVADLDYENADWLWTDLLVDGVIDDSKLTTYVQQVVAYDRLNGLSEEDIIEKRACLLVQQFLGTTHQQLINEGFTELVESVDEEGNTSSTYNIRKCSLEYLNY
jgi:hypothetical protein